jgi:hypothetical protein
MADDPDARLRATSYCILRFSYVQVAKPHNIFLQTGLDILVVHGVKAGKFDTFRGRHGAAFY